MRKITLYTDRKSLSPIATDGWHVADFVRLIAEEGRAITDGVTVTTCVDTNRPELWTDCDATSEEVPAEEALAELMEVLA